MRTSLSRRFLIGLGLTSLAFTLLASIAAFAVFQRELEVRQIAFLDQYVRERTDNVDRRFSNLMTLHRTAIDVLNARMASMTPAQAQRMIDENTILLPDGTRRSPAKAFDGYIDRAGARVSGIGMFFSHPAEMTAPEKEVLAASIPIVESFGQAAHGDYDNFYFFTPQNRLVMFGPDRPDKLMFYRQNAPATLDYTKEEMSLFITPAADPTGETRCTSLQHLLQDAKKAQRVATACVTPAYVAGHYVGAFGSSIKLTDFLNQVVDNGLPGAETLIIRDDGVLIAAPRNDSAAVGSEKSVAAYERKLGLSTLAKTLVATGRPFGMAQSANGKNIIAYGRLTGPGWYLLLSYPRSAVAASAARSASWVLLLGLLGATLQTVVLLILARRTIVTPLQTLAESCRTQAYQGSNALAGRSDEIGILARSLRGERERADELLGSLEQRVQLRTAELERANTEKSRFLANMSHELRTPLNGVIALSETLVKSQITPHNVEVAELIVASGRLLEQVLTDILDVSKIEAGEMGIESRPFDLQTVICQVAALHRASAEAKGLKLNSSLAPEIAGAYLGDSVRLTQVLSNLLSNAVKFTEAGEVVLTVGRCEGGIRFCVSDTGIGFDEEVRARLFQRFEQADVSIRRRFGGTGLGLAICQSLVGLMGGRIETRSTPGEGSVFSFELALQPAEIEHEYATGDAQDDDAFLEPVRVLLAEDHPTNQKVVQLILESVGAELTIVENGRLALKALERHAFDVVLMDMQMPELDGLSATTLLREREAANGLAHTPVIMLTANAMDEHRQASFAAGADRHLSKPLRAAELLDAIAEVVSEPPRRSQPVSQPTPVAAEVN
jgi:signal transduction histidine kinase/CheY-like chemotaxis protein